MNTIEVSSTTGWPDEFLDVTPMIAALQFRPTDFEFSDGWLAHVPSRHRFRFDDDGHVTIDARCECSLQPVRPGENDQLLQAFASWRRHYWRPFEVNREFASHFAMPNAWFRLLRDIRMAWRRFRRQADPVMLPTDTLIAGQPEYVPIRVSPVRGQPAR
jgi:hypothetical protein